MTETLFKWLTANNSAPLGSGKWHKNRWRSVKGDLVPCENGLHLARSKELVNHISDRLWTAEADMSEVVEWDDKIVVRRARVIGRIETINDSTLRAFAADCADRVVHLTGPDPRCVAAIALARRFAKHNATPEELDAAWAAACIAAREATICATAGTAAWAAAWAAANAPGAGAGARLYAAATDAAWAGAKDCGGGGAAMDVAWAAAWAAANARLLQYVELGLSAMDMPWPDSPAWPIGKRKAA
jgi:hypothetical protein